MKVEVSDIDKNVLRLLPENVKEWHLLRSLKSIAPMLPMVGSSLWLTSAPYTEPDADSRKVMAGTALRIVECTPSPAA